MFVHCFISRWALAHGLSGVGYQSQTIAWRMILSIRLFDESSTLPGQSTECQPRI